MSKKPEYTPREKELLSIVHKLQKSGKKQNTQIKTLKVHNAHLVASVKRWAHKFSNDKYRVPVEEIEKMKRELDNYKERSRAELDAERARSAVLMQRVLELTEQKYSDSFGDSKDAGEVSYEFASNHVDSIPTKGDRETVHLQLSKEWAQRMSKMKQ